MESSKIVKTVKAIGINGSPRKTWNTAILLEHALDGVKSKGGEISRIDLYDLKFKGCTSCFACKLTGEKHSGQCAMRDDLTEVLECITASDILVLGPIG